MRSAALLLRGVLLALCSSALSCSDDTDYVRVVVRTNDPTVSISVLDLRVAVFGGEQKTSFSYQAQPKKAARAPGSPDLSDFTVSFGKSPPPEVDLRIVTRPSGKAFDWGGDAHVTLPGDGRAISLTLTAGEQDLHAANPLDGDAQSITGYGGGVAVAWPTTTAGNTRVSAVSINPERVQGLERPGELGTGIKKPRVASRPSESFTSDLYVTSWIEESARPTLRAEVRNQKTDDTPKLIDNLPGTTDLHVACDSSKTARLPIVSAALAENRVVVYGHDETGNNVTKRIESPGLTPVNGIAGIVVTPDETLALAVNGNGARLVQISLRNDNSLGSVVSEQPLTGTPVAMSRTADGSRLLVATVRNAGDPRRGELLLQAFSSKNPAPSGDPVRVAPYPFTAGDPASHVALSSCAIAWPQRRTDGTNLTDIWFNQLDLDQKPTGEPHVANVSQEGHHWAPSIVCLSTQRVYATFFSGPDTHAANATLTMRRLPTN